MILSAYPERFLDLPSWRDTPFWLYIIRFQIPMK